METARLSRGWEHEEIEGFTALDDALLFLRVDPRWRDVLGFDPQRFVDAAGELFARALAADLRPRTRRIVEAGSRWLAEF
ncbi:MAG: hypothetical protein HY552_00850 [Elusimicrobia bacterium]|nr:hypothetical protein [Elusimicrobiota bacterium]